MPRDGTNNLIPPRSKDEARTRGKNGGIASGKARREKKALRETMQELLTMKLMMLSSPLSAEKIYWQRPKQIP